MEFNAKIIAVIIASSLIAAGAGASVYFYMNEPTKEGSGGGGGGGSGGDGTVIVDVNQAPSISNLPNQTLPEDSQLLDAFNLSDYSSDPDSDPLTYSILVNTEPNCGVSMDGQNLVDITPTANWSGLSYITVQVSDGKLTATDIFKVNITLVNDPLFIVDFSPTYDPKINETESQEFSITVSDIDNSSFIYEWSTWYNNTGTGVGYLGGDSDNYLYNTNYESNGTHTIKVNVTDSEFVVEKIWTLNVSNKNRAPAITYYSPLSSIPSINENEQQDFNITVKDDDGDPLTTWWYINGSLEKTGGNLTLIADYEFAGTYIVKVNISDGQDTVDHEWTLIVCDENEAPQITQAIPISIIPTINENEQQDFEITISDPDNDPLTVKWYVDGVLEQTGGNYTFSADYDSAGEYEIKVNITDGEFVDEYTWTLTVNNVNRAPQITDTSPASITPSINENEKQDFNATIKDDDDDPLIIRWYIDGELKQTGGNYTFTSDFNSAGIYIVKVNATDSTEVVDHVWTLTVNNVNRAPVAGIVNDNVVSNMGWFVKLNGSDSYDPDGNEEIDTYLWDFGDGTYSTGRLTNHSYSASGDYTIKLTVNDTYGLKNEDIIYVNVQDYIEIEIETGHGSAVDSDTKVAQILDFGKPFYLYNITVYIKYLDNFPVTGNLTLELQGVSFELQPDGTIYYIKTFIDISEGWINVPINGLYVSDKIYVVTYIMNTLSPSYYAIAYNGGSDNDEFTCIDIGTGFYGVAWDQTMNCTYLWANTTSDVNTPPQARIVNDDVVSNVDWKVQFDASDSWDANGLGDIDTYFWDFGDGSYGTGVKINHTYTVPGKYKAILTINDSFGVDASDWRLVTVRDYSEIELESHLAWTINNYNKIAQMLDLGNPFYLYNVTVHIQKVGGSFPVTGDLTLRLLGVDIIRLPTDEVFYSITIFDISEGWINIPIYGFLVEDIVGSLDIIYVETYITNTPSPAFYSLTIDGQTSPPSDCYTALDQGLGYEVTTYDQVMSITILWTDTTPDVFISNAHLDMAILNEPTLYSPSYQFPQQTKVLNINLIDITVLSTVPLAFIFWCNKHRKKIGASKNLSKLSH